MLALIRLIIHQTCSLVIVLSYPVENGVDLAIGIENSGLASELHDLAHDDDILANVRIEHVCRNAGC